MKPNSLVSSCTLSNSSVSAAKRPEYMVPALLTRMSTPPSCCFAPSTTSRAMSASSDMSACTACTSPPVSLASASRAAAELLAVAAADQHAHAFLRNSRAVS